MSANFRVPQFSVEDAVELARTERMKRGIIRDSGFFAKSKQCDFLMVPQWVNKYPALRAKVRRMRTQKQIDAAVAAHAKLIGRTVYGFAPVPTRTLFPDVTGHASAPVKRDHRKTPAVRNLPQK